MTTNSSEKFRQQKGDVEDQIMVCPGPGNSLWSYHPRVYLAPDEQGRVKCPYCGATSEKNESKSS